MTLKNSIAGLPHDGEKAGIIADHDAPKKELYFKDFARQIKALLEYIPGPDMGSDEQAMGWVFEEIKDATGSVINHKKGNVKKPEDIFSLDCEILIPAATPDVIHKDNKRKSSSKTGCRRDCKREGAESYAKQ